MSQRRPPGPSRLVTALATAVVLLVAGCGDTTDGQATDVPSGPVSPTSHASNGAGDGLATAGAWVLVEGVIGGQSVQPPPDARVDLAIDGDQATGTAACNGFGGTVQVDGDRVSFSRMAQTEMGCERSLMAVEAAYLGALADVTTWVRDGDRLTLTGPDGLVLEFVEELPADDAALVGVRWQLESLVTDGGVSSTSGDGFVEFQDDGTVVGSTGCRRFEGTWQQGGAEIVFPNLAVQGQCPPELESQDSHVVSVLERFTVEVDGDRLHLVSTQGNGDGLDLRVAE